MPQRLVDAIVKARDANRTFNNELEKWLEKIKNTPLEPKNQWMIIIEGLSEGHDINLILEEAQIHPKTTDFRDILESLKAHGFSDDFLNALITEINPEHLNDTLKQILKKQLELEIEA